MTNKVGKAVDQSPEQQSDDSESEPEPLKVLSYFDFLENRFVWTKEFHNKCDATTFRQNELLALLDESSQLRILEIDSGEVLFQSQIDLPDGEVDFISQIEMEEFAACHILKLQATGRRSTRFQASNGTYFRMIGSGTFWNGHVIALSKKEFQPLWKHPANVQWFQSNYNLPWASPVYLMYRRVDRFGIRSTDRYRIQVVAFDTRSGRLLANALMPYFYLVDYRVTVEPEQQAVYFHGRNDKVRFRFTDESPPPRPVAFLGEQNSMYSIALDYLPQAKTFTQREKERQALLERLTLFQEIELEKKRAAMQKLLEKRPDN